MKKVVLSDHTQDQADAAANKRRAEYEAATAAHASALSKREAYHQELVENSEQLWTQKRYVAWFFSYMPRISHALSSTPRAPQLAAAGRDEIVWNAGGDGEQRVLSALAGQLSDEWVAVSGYKNPGGEIDVVLVGPDGVMAVEIKFVNGQVHCDGDRWWRDKSDKYGNVVERNVAIADRKGRGPSAQVNASADRLQRFLAERTPVKRVLRAVVFSHDASSIGTLKSVTVDAIATLTSFVPKRIYQEKLGTGHQLLVDDLVRLIGNDHVYHASRKPR